MQSKLYPCHNNILPNIKPNLIQQRYNLIKTKNILIPQKIEKQTLGMPHHHHPNKTHDEIY